MSLILQNIQFTPDEEAALDRAWEQMSTQQDRQRTRRARRSQPPMPHSAPHPPQKGGRLVERPPKPE